MPPGRIRMTEIINNLVQMGILIVCMVIVIFRSVSGKSRTWLVYALFLTSYFLGDLWWFLELVLYKGKLGYSLVPYINWKASILFLILLLQLNRPGADYGWSGGRILWGIPLFCSVLCIFYMQYGAYFDNITTAILMSILMWMAARGLLNNSKEDKEKRRVNLLYQVTLIFCGLEYVMWTITCLDYGNPLRYLYPICDLAISISFILFLPAIRRVVD